MPFESSHNCIQNCYLFDLGPLMFFFLLKVLGIIAMLFVLVWAFNKERRKVTTELESVSLPARPASLGSLRAAGSVLWTRELHWQHC